MSEASTAHRRLERFSISLVIAVVIFTTLTYGSIYLRTRALLYESLRTEAATYHEIFMTTRWWIAEQGGVWVELRPGVKQNPYFERLAITDTVQLADGRYLVLRNPGLVTTQISERLEAARGVGYHLASLDPINPLNAPDEWERESLEEFESDRTPRWVIAKSRNGESLRYVTPLIAQTECLSCHSDQHLQVGGVVGAATVEVPVAHVKSQLRATATTLSVLALLTAGAATLTLLLISRRVNDGVNKAHLRLAEVARTDDLTGLLNRRGTLERLDEEIDRARRTSEPLSVMLLDLDEFKLINDRHDHTGGDVALQHFARLLKDESRSYDIVGRVGGEEFLVIAPGLDCGRAAALAERIRIRVGAEPALIDGERVPLSVSAGVAAIGEGESRDSLILRSDRAMYAAKDAGRNRVMIAKG